LAIQRIGLLSLCYLPPDDNKEDLAVANIKGIKFAISNWMAHSNTRAMLNDTGKEGHVFMSKHKQSKNQDIITMLGVYILDVFELLLQLVQKMQLQLKQPTHGNVKLQMQLGQIISKSIFPIDTSLIARIH
jgi:hypothetical protein